jgi:predicted nucleotidyltransferase
MREAEKASDILDLLRRFIAVESERFPVRAAYLFGSWAYGEPSQDSDIDLGIVVDADLSPEEETKLFTDAQKIDWKIEPVVFSKGYFDTARLSIIHDIKTKGIQIV